MSVERILNVEEFARILRKDDSRGLGNSQPSIRVPSIRHQHSFISTSIPLLAGESSEDAECFANELCGWAIFTS